MRNVRSLACICMIAFLSLSMSGKSELCESTEEKQLPKFKLENIRPLTDGTTLYMRPVWSPDGSKISFTKRGNQDILVVDADGREKERVVAEGAIGWDYAWSPDGHKIVYRVRREWREKEKIHVEYQIEVANVETGQVKPVVQHSRLISYPVWLKAEEIVYAVENEKSEWNLLYIDENGTIQKTLNHIGGTTIRLSPKDDKIAYTIGGLRILTTKHPRKQITAKDDATYLPIAFSPGGEKLVVATGDALRIVNTTTGEITELGDLHAHATKGCWSLDGQWIVYHISYDDGHRILASDLYLIRSDGTRKIHLTNTEDSIEMGPYFSPDGESIVFWTDETGIIWRADLCEEVGE